MALAGASATVTLRAWLWFCPLQPAGRSWPALTPVSLPVSGEALAACVAASALALQGFHEFKGARPGPVPEWFRSTGSALGSRSPECIPGKNHRLLSLRETDLSGLSSGRLRSARRSEFFKLRTWRCVCSSRSLPQPGLEPGWSGSEC